MTKNKNYRKQLNSHYEAIEEHLQKIQKELEKSPEFQDLDLIGHWENTILNCRQQIAKLQRRLEK
jgi:poly-D-alanine transfer protein DltD